MAEAQDESKAGTITDYLQAPRKKRRTYVIMALSHNFNRDVSFKIENFIKKRYKGLAISHPKTDKELMRQFGRKISLLIMDDEFAPLDSVLKMVEGLKVRRREENIPVLFMTRNSEKLVEGYRKVLAGFHEVDDFCSYVALEAKQIIGRIRAAIENRNTRKSRRYQVNIPLTFYHLTADKTIAGSLIDLSVHGAQLKSTDIDKFKIGDQLKINLPISKFLQPEHGEFMSISAKVRRVFIAGNLAGISFEYMSEDSQYMLTKYVTAFVHYQLGHRV